MFVHSENKRRIYGDLAAVAFNRVKLNYFIWCILYTKLQSVKNTINEHDDADDDRDDVRLSRDIQSCMSWVLQLEQ